jgi:hypothetical protein
MTSLTASRPATAADRLCAVLLVDGVGTVALGAAALAAAGPLSDVVGTPGLLRAVGVLLVLVGADMLLTRRLTGRALSRAAAALGVADMLFALTVTGAVLVLGASAAGTAVVLGVAAVCVAMGTAKLVLSRGV